jgi:UDP-glucose 4-epimerase
VIPIFLSGALLGSEIEIHGDGTQSRDFTYVSDVCEVLFKTCFSYFTHSHPINLAFGTNISINELVHTIDSLIDRKTKTRYIGGRQGDVHESQADIKLFSTLFPNLKPVPLTDGLATTIASLREGLSLGS